MDPTNQVVSLVSAVIAIVIAQGGEVFVPDVITATVNPAADRIVIERDVLREGHTIRIVRDGIGS